MKYPYLLCLLIIIAGLGMVAVPAHTGTSGCVDGNGKIKKEPRELPPFSGITVDGAFDVRVTCGKKQLVEVTADSNLLPLITTAVKDKNLNIDTSRSICTKSDLLVTISLPDMEQAVLGGAADMTITGVSNRKFTLQSDGAGDIGITGKTGLFKAAVKGSTDLKAQQFIADSIQIRIEDAGEATVHATQKLEASATGAATITYYGNPKAVTKKVDDAAEIVSGDKVGADEEAEEDD